MGRYKEKNISSLVDLLIPPLTYKIEIEDTETGEKGEGVGFTIKEARKNAWRDLESKLKSDPKSKKNR